MHQVYTKYGRLLFFFCCTMYFWLCWIQWTWTLFVLVLGQISHPLLRLSYPLKTEKAPYLEGDCTAHPLLLHHSTLNLCSQSVRHSTAGHGHHGASQHSKSGFLRWSMAFCHSRSHRCQQKPDCAVHLDSILHLSSQDNNNHYKN